jgi:isopentenyl-diphosphate delta-isomerase
MDYVITVDEQDLATGTEEKLTAHVRGVLHRAFSVFVFNDAGELLLQQRAKDKYHSGGLWTNTCCSHPKPGEDTLGAAHRRLAEEMGFDCELRYLRPFRYEAQMDNGLIENELDHLYTGICSHPIHPNPSEVMDYRYLSLQAIKKWVAREPRAFTAWFRLILPHLDL